MKFLIQNPAPEDVEDRVYWGDAYFGQALADALQELGCQVITRYWPNWEGAEDADVLLVLRGLRKSSTRVGDFQTRIVWLISHPEEVDDDELSQFDLILCASTFHTRELRARGFNCHTVLQCTDESIFFPEPGLHNSFEYPFVFIGNGRAERKIVHKAVSAGIPLRIWGRGWDRGGCNRAVVAPFVHNSKLGALYRSSFCSLNDHWSDMSEYQYINNRVYDALACGLPLISSPHEGLDELNFGGVLVAQHDEPIDDLVDRFLLNHELLRQKAQADSEQILKEHTFKARAGSILGLLG